MAKARRFKKKLASKSSKRKIESILSVELIRKETLEKIRELWKKLISRLKSLKLAN